MRRACTWTSGWLLSCSLAFAATTPAIQPTSKLASLLKSKAIDASYAVSYRDKDGKPMTRTAFAEGWGKSGSYMLKRDPSAHTATFTLLAKDSDLKLSAAQMAAFTAQLSGKSLLKAGQPVPAFQLETANGQRVDNTALRGHLTLVNFFFADCVGCIAETPMLTAYAKKHPRQHVLAVTFDDAATARAYVAAHGFSWPILVDGSAFDQAMGVNVYPVMALVGPDGRLQKMIIAGQIPHRGPALNVGDLERWVGSPIGQTR